MSSSQPLIIFSDVKKIFYTTTSRRMRYRNSSRY